jgi:hypothetical protein
MRTLSLENLRPSTLGLIIVELDKLERDGLANDEHRQARDDAYGRLLEIDDESWVKWAERKLR